MTTLVIPTLFYLQTEIMINVNVIVYVLLNRDYREEVAKLMCSEKKSSKAARSSDAATMETGTDVSAR